MGAEEGAEAEAGEGAEAGADILEDIALVSSNDSLMAGSDAHGKQVTGNETHPSAKAVVIEMKKMTTAIRKEIRQTDATIAAIRKQIAANRAAKATLEAYSNGSVSNNESERLGKHQRMSQEVEHLDAAFDELNATLHSAINQKGSEERKEAIDELKEEEAKDKEADEEEAAEEKALEEAKDKEADEEQTEEEAALEGEKKEEKEGADAEKETGNSGVDSSTLYVYVAAAVVIPLGGIKLICPRNDHEESYLRMS